MCRPATLWTSPPADDECASLVAPAEPPSLRHIGSQPAETLRPRAGAVASLLAVLAMSGYLVLGKHHVSQHEPGGFALCRQCVGALLMTISAYGRHGDSAFKLHREHYGAIAKLGLLNYLNSICFIWGFRLTSAFVASVAQLSVPVATYLYTSAVGLEQPSCRKSAGVALIVCGCLLTAMGSSANHSGGASARVGTGLMLWLGLGALALQTGAFSGMLIVQKRILHHYPVAVVSCFGYSAGAVVSLASSTLDGSIAHLPQHFNSPTAISIVIYSATVGALAYFELITFATKHLPASFVACSVALEPLAVSMLGILCFHYEVTPLEAVGYAVAMLGVAAMAAVIVRDGPTLNSPRRRALSAVAPA